MTGGAEAHAHLSIGEVLALLQEEFPDCTISKIRFLESQGLIQPDRTASGYRKFYEADIERLRWILRQQRDHFLPLKVIRKMLDEGIDRYDPGGGEQPTLFTPSDPEPEDLESAHDGDAGGPDRGGGLEHAAQPHGVAERAGGPEPVGGGESGADRPDTAPSTRSPRHPAVASAPPKPPKPPKPARTPRRPRPGASGHETPADVVAALQEDPRRSKEKGARSDQVHQEDDDGGTGRSPAPVRTPIEEPAMTSNALTAEEICSATGIDPTLLAGLERFGLVVATSRGGEVVYGDEAVAVCRLAARYAEHGVEPRHLRMYLVAAEREAGFVEQLAVPLLKQRNPAAREQARALARELEEMGVELHSLLLRRELGPDLGG